MAGTLLAVKRGFQLRAGRCCEHKATLTALLALLDANLKNIPIGMFKRKQVLLRFYVCVLAQWWQQQRRLQGSQSSWWRRSWASLVRATLFGASPSLGEFPSAPPFHSPPRRCVQGAAHSSVHRTAHWLPSQWSYLRVAFVGGVH